MSRLASATAANAARAVAALINPVRTRERAILISNETEHANKRDYSQEGSLPAAAADDDDDDAAGPRLGGSGYTLSTLALRRGSLIVDFRSSRGVSLEIFDSSTGVRFDAKSRGCLGTRRGASVWRLGYL